MTSKCNMWAGSCIEKKKNCYKGHYGDNRKTRYMG